MISLIAAIQKKDRGLGYKGDLLFRIPDDLKRFSNITKGHPVIMGRKTFESIGRPLPNRLNIVITRNKDYLKEGILITDSLENAIKIAKEKDKDIFIIGGGEIYSEGINFANRLYLTMVTGKKPADTFFPSFEGFTKVIEKSGEIKNADGISFEYLTLE